MTDVLPDRPNILLIITDHHAFYGHDVSSGVSSMGLRMPTFARLANGGARFDRAYSVSPICTPARSSMVTGQYPSAHGLRWNTDGIDPGRRLDFRPGQVLYSHHLARAGYRNAYVGKWHCGHERLPHDYGIEGWSLPDYGTPYLDPAYRAYAGRFGHPDARARIEHSVNRPQWAGQARTLDDPSPWTFMDSAGVLEGPPEVHENQFTAQLAIEKMRELAAAQRRNSQPWSLVASFWGPHHPYFPSEPFASMFDPASIPEYPSFRDDYSGNRPLRSFMHRDLHHGTAQKWPDWATWQQILARCYGQIMQTDAAIGQILDELDLLGAAENTLVIWVADHGDAIASHGGLWDKASTYSEEVARVPLAVRWPAAFSGGLHSEARVTNMDVTATMLQAAGLEIPESLSSRSLLDACAGDDSGLPGHIVAEHNGHGEELLMRIAVTARYKYAAALFDTDELYDLDDDPYETRNLVDEPEYADMAHELRGLLAEHIEREGDRTAARLLYSLRLPRR